MKLTFGPDDENGFASACSLLLGRFESWLRDELGLTKAAATEMAFAASAALDWKWSYGDGNLGLWRVEDLEEFLLDWCPRKLSVSPTDCVTIPPSLAAFVEFMHTAGLLAPGSSPVVQLSEAAIEMTDDFVFAMGDSSNYGMAKSLCAAALDEGVDLEDPHELQEWMAELNDRPADERQAIMGSNSFLSPPRRAVPPIALPKEAEVTASRAQAPVLDMFAEMAAYIGDGRKLTQKGNLTMADARALVELLGTGDVVDEVIGDRTFRTTSSAELYRLHHLFIWAKKAGVVRVKHGKAIATKAGLAIMADPGAFFERAVGALLALGALSSQRSRSGWFARPDVDELLDEAVVFLLVRPYVLGAPVPIDDLAEVATDGVLGAFTFSSLSDDEVKRSITPDVVDMIDALELAGVVRRAEIVPPGSDDIYPGLRRRGGTVELTAAGVLTTRRLLLDAGWEAPVAGAFADASATDLLLAADTSDLATLQAELGVWLA
nr:hypothetical protein [Actinomycetota bacterium]